MTITNNTSKPIFFWYTNTGGFVIEETERANQDLKIMCWELIPGSSWKDGIIYED